MVQFESGPGPIGSPLTLPANARLPDASLLVLDYERRWDILYLSLREPRPAASMDVDGQIWARVIPDSGEIVGFEIEEFEHRFLAHHPDLAAAWRAARRRRLFGLLPQAQPQAFLGQMLGFLESVVAKQGAQPASRQSG